MKRVNRLGIIAVLAVGTVMAPAFAGNVTVGHFYTELAQAKHLVSVDAASSEASLRGAGFALPKLALDKSLSEGDMTSISHALGVAVTTQRPSQLVTETQMGTFMTSFGSQIGAPSLKGGGVDQVNPNDPDGRYRRHRRQPHRHSHKSPHSPD